MVERPGDSAWRDLLKLAPRREDFAVGKNKVSLQNGKAYPAEKIWLRAKKKIHPPKRRSPMFMM